MREFSVISEGRDPRQYEYSHASALTKGNWIRPNGKRHDCLITCQMRMTMMAQNWLQCREKNRDATFWCQFTRFCEKSQLHVSCCGLRFRAGRKIGLSPSAQCFSVNCTIYTQYIKKRSHVALFYWHVQYKNNKAWRRRSADNPRTHTDPANMWLSFHWTISGSWSDR